MTYRKLRARLLNDAKGLGVELIDNFEIPAKHTAHLALPMSTRPEDAGLEIIVFVVVLPMDAPVPPPTDELLTQLSDQLHRARARRRDERA